MESLMIKTFEKSIENRSWIKSLLIVGYIVAVLLIAGLARAATTGF